MAVSREIAEAVAASTVAAQAGRQTSPLREAAADRTSFPAGKFTDGTRAGNGLITIIYAEPPPTADVAVSIVGPASAKKGVHVTYLITVSNAGPDTAHNVVLSNPLPSGSSLSASRRRRECAHRRKRTH
jgi:uncharacterized repeat protein (TIGR01451 family)